MSTTATEVKSQLRRELNFWDVLFFNIATVLGPRWIASAANSGPSSLSIWTIAALFFFMPTALIIVELSTRYPTEGGLYIWAKEAFGEFHGFVAGWAYWTYTMFYFPGLLLASASMAAYIGGDRDGKNLSHAVRTRTGKLVGAFSSITPCLRFCS